MNKPNAGPPPPPNDDEIVVNGKRYCYAQVHCIFYSGASYKSQRVGSLVDREANGLRNLIARAEVNDRSQ